jgi:hypothetical protein
VDEKPIGGRQHADRVVEQEVRRQQKEREASFRRLITITGAVGALSSVALAFWASQVNRSDDLLAAKASVQVERAMADREKEITALQRELEAAKNQLRSSSSTPSSSSDVAALGKRLDAIEAEQKRLSTVITDSPEKAVSLPLMRRDIDDIKGSQTQVAEALRREIDRVFDINKWIIGGLAAGVLSLIVRDVFRNRGGSASE